MKWTEQFRRANRAGVPLVAISSPDPMATMKVLKDKVFYKERPILVWDCLRGLSALNEQGKLYVNDMNGDPAAFLMEVAPGLPDGAVVFMLSADEYLDHTPTRQGIWNLRDSYKSSGRMLVMLGNSFKIPASLINDVVLIDEEYPDEESVRERVQEIDNAVSESVEGRTTMSDCDLERMTDALRGLSLFAVEQITAMNATKVNMDVDGAWESKRKQIEQQDGLSIYRGPERFVDIGGQRNLKTYLERKINGNRPFKGVVFVDEIEKLLAGSSTSGGDSSGVSQGILQCLLTYMQDKEVNGIILIGPPGTGKSMLAKSMGNEAEVPTISLDTNAMKGSLVGESEKAMRNALKVIDSVTGGKSFWIATCNSISSLPAELRRRFTRGIFFIDLPNGVERKEIWKAYMAKYGLKKQPLPKDEGWTGAEIKNCCDTADDLDISLKEASRYIVPVSVSAKATIDGLRRDCDGKYLSGTYDGLFRATQDQGGRKICLDN